jgi:3-vinyl bacteriochlorophyllide hydratase
MTLQYTPAQLHLRDTSIWTKVQAVLAPTQFIAFIVSVILVYRAWHGGYGYDAAKVSILIKISLLWAITITGMIWEKEIFGHYFWQRILLGRCGERRRHRNSQYLFFGALVGLE